MAKAVAIKGEGYKGIRYREHKTRKHGVKYDRYFYIRYRLGGKLREEGWGWESEGFTAKGALNERDKIMQAIKAGDEIATLKERRAEADRVRTEKSAVEAAAAEEAETAAITFGYFFENAYKKYREEKALVPELPLYKYWIKPVLGNKRFAEITELDMAKIKRRALKGRMIKKKGKETQGPPMSLRTINYAYAVVRQVYTAASVHGVYSGAHPITSAVKRNVRFDSNKTRYLTIEEADALLDKLKGRRQQVHDMALISLYCGLRAGEVFGLTWADVNMNDNVIHLRNTKSKKDRYVPMPPQVVELFSGYEFGKGNTMIFTKLSKMHGEKVKPGKIDKISHSFMRAVNELGLNDGITDRKQKFTFHGLRHTYASWLVQAGIPLITVQKLLGHSSITMTERYSHLSPDNNAAAIKVLENIGKASEIPSEKKVVNIRGS